MNRNLLNHGPGKGDKPRNKYDENWRQRVSEVQYPKKTMPESGFILVRGRWVKKYA